MVIGLFQMNGKGSDKMNIYVIICIASILFAVAGGFAGYFGKKPLALLLYIVTIILLMMLLIL